jgi:subtilisin family serine protease
MSPRALRPVWLALMLAGTSLAGPAPAGDTARPQTDHLTRLGADRWHAAGFRGRGVRVAVLDSGFRGYRDYLGRSLPDHVLTRSFRDDGNLEAKDSQHGILCGEVIHALAPEAELLFANWEPDRPDRFLDAVRWAASQGARVISCSLIMPSWGDGEGGGPVHRQLATLVGPTAAPDGRLFFASAGNTAERHWSGPFRDGSGWHVWAGGRTDNPVTPWGSDRVSVELSAPAGAAFEVRVVDRDGTEVGRAVNRDGTSAAVVRFLPESNRGYHVRVRRLSGDRRATFHLVALGAYLGLTTPGGSVTFPADNPDVVAVGAVDESDRRLSYSSCGPNSSRPKPDLVAPVPFPTAVRAKPFGGTSAAAPQAAALAALWWSRHPSWTADRVREALSASARDLEAKGHDFQTGFGLIRLPAPSGSDKRLQARVAPPRARR